MTQKNKGTIRVSPALRPGHPLTGEECLICHQLFAVGQRIIFAPPIEPQSDVDYVPSVPIHADCALRGVKTSVGEIARIVDGDGSPLLVLMTDGKRHTLREAGFEG